MTADELAYLRRQLLAAPAPAQKRRPAKRPFDVELKIFVSEAMDADLTREADRRGWSRQQVIRWILQDQLMPPSAPDPRGCKVVAERVTAGRGRRRP